MEYDGNHGVINGVKHGGYDAKARSKTFTGIAQAMADQWGVLGMKECPHKLVGVVGFGHYCGKYPNKTKSCSGEQNCKELV